MQLIQQGSIVMVNFPYSDTEITKQRPALVISKTENNHTLVNVLKITSVIRNDIHSFKITEEMFATPKPSEIRLNDIMTISANKIIRDNGVLQTKHLLQVLNKFKVQF